MSRALLVMSWLLAMAAVSAAAQSAPMAPSHPTKSGADFFEKKIRPILVRHCYECHSGDPKKAKSHLVLDTREGLRKGGDSGPVIVPGHPDDSPLIEAVRYEGLEMPPKEKLPDELIDTLVEWIEMGAPDPRSGKAAMSRGKIDLAEARKFWAFQRPKAVPPPKVHDGAWPLSDIDRFVAARREAEHLKPAPDADRVTLIRRVTFDLTGLPPTPEEIDAFLADTSAHAFAGVVDRLLASERFGERWGRHWLDVARYGESTGKERNIPYRYAWRYRNYVIDAFNADKPYDRFIVEQLAGDLLPSKNAAERDRLLIATGFLAIGPKGVNTKEKEQFRYDVIDDQIDVTGRAFLAMTVACARCHDHKYDPIPTSDYYAMAGIFHSTDTFAGVRAGKKTASDKALLTLASAGNHPRKSPNATREQQDHEAEIDKLEKQIGDLRKLQRQSKQQMRTAQKGQVQKGKKKGPPPPAGPKVDQKQVREQIKKLEDRLDDLEAIPSAAGDFVMAVRDGTPENSPVLNRGELKDKGSPVTRGVLSVIKTPEGNVNPKHSGRLELAHWIAGKDNPLTARVMVNRAWQHLFGQALVPSSDNFGALGDEPSHPELLDYLATQFMHEDKWSAKKLIRSIVLSRTYQMSSEFNSENHALDPANRFLWRMERRRLDAEEIRDAMLATSGELDVARPEGSPVLELSNAQIRGGKGLQEIKRPSNVRSVYLPELRGNVPEMLQVFDAADPSLIIGKRDVTTVATQALFLMNSPFVLKRSEQFARRILASQGLTPATRIDLAYRLALGRVPAEQEKSNIAKYLADYRKSLEGGDHKGNPQLAAWASVCQTLFASGEFRYVY